MNQSALLTLFFAFFIPFFCDASAASAPSQEGAPTLLEASQYLNAAVRHPNFRRILEFQRKSELTADDAHFLEQTVLNDPITPVLAEIIQTPKLTYGQLIREASPAIHIQWIAISRYVQTLAVAVASQGLIDKGLDAAKLLNRTAQFLATGTVSQLPQMWSCRTRAEQMVSTTIKYATSPEAVREGLKAIEELGVQSISLDPEAALKRERELAPDILVAEGILTSKQANSANDKILLEAQKSVFADRINHLPSVGNEVLSTDDLKELRASYTTEIMAVDQVLALNGTYSDWLKNRLDIRLKAYGDFRPALFSKIDSVRWDLLRIGAARKLCYLETGKKPDVKDLVPKYLKTLPKDPFDPQGGTYRANDTVVYSLGHDGKDDGGKIKAPLIPSPDRDFGTQGDITIEIPW